MMVCRSAALCLLFSLLASGYIAPDVAARNRADVTALRSTTRDDTFFANGNPISARTARLVVLPSLLGLGTSLPANAGIGTPVPFEEARKKSFPGSLRNSVIAMRVSSSLRKVGYRAGSSVAGVFSKSDLGVTLSKEFADGRVFGLEDVDDFANRCGETHRAIVLFGPEVDISREGEVGDVKGDLKTGETYIREKLVGKIPEITLLGGLVIHTPKGGTDGGEDYFQPLMMETINAKGERDFYEEAFGDLPTPRK